MVDIAIRQIENEMRQITYSGLRTFCCAAVAVAAITPTVANAHHPDRETQEPHQRIDVIGPLGNWWPASYRRRYNRPTYLGGKIAYYIAPSSQEAMAWHRAEHIGAYKNHLPRTENLYFYPKPWEAMQVGQRYSVLKGDKNPPAPKALPDSSLEYGGLISPVYTEDIPSPIQTLETTDLPIDRFQLEPDQR